MKTHVGKSEKIKCFQPFEITFKLETLNEARLMFHVCNSNSLRDKIFVDYRSHVTKSELPTSFSGGWFEIQEVIEAQGFKVDEYK